MGDSYHNALYLGCSDIILVFHLFVTKTVKHLYLSIKVFASIILIGYSKISMYCLVVPTVNIHENLYEI